MVRTQVILTQEQVSRLKKLAAERESSVSQLVRESVDRLLDENDRRKRWDRSMEAIGRFRSGKSDVSVNHDRYLDEIYGAW